LALDQLEVFMAAIRRMESGSYEGNYSATGPRSSSLGIPLGAYQIMSANWASWASQAGLAGADWRSREAQDAVARHKFTEYYNRYQDWGLVAIAWFAGPGRADEARRNGISSVGAIKDSLGTSVSTYVTNVNSYMARYREREGLPLPSEDMTARYTGMARSSSPVTDLWPSVSGTEDQDMWTAMMEWFGQQSSGEAPSSPLRSRLLTALSTISSSIAKVNKARLVDPLEGTPEDVRAEEVQRGELVDGQ
jgi:hypothetical protein